MDERSTEPLTDASRGPARAPPQAPAASSHPGDRFKAIGLLLIALVLFSALDSTAKYLGTRSDLPIVQIVWVRFAGQFLVMLTLLSTLPLSSLFATTKFGWELVRSLMMVVTTACNFLALQHLRLDQTVTVIFLGPLIVALLAGPLLNEWVGWRRFTAILVGFTGILIAVRPGAGLHPAFAYAFGAVLAFSFFVLLTRYLAAHDRPLVMLFFSILLGTFALAPFAVWQWVWPQSTLEWVLLAAMGTLGGVGHYLFIHAYRLAPAPIVAPFLYLQLLTMVAFGYIVFDQVPDAWTLAGSVVIIGSGIYLIHRERVTKTLVEPVEPI
jgi:drug/metabolite transporter (DMT)-like permease